MTAKLHSVCISSAILSWTARLTDWRWIHRPASWSHGFANRRSWSDTLQMSWAAQCSSAKQRLKSVRGFADLGRCCRLARVGVLSCTWWLASPRRRRGSEMLSLNATCLCRRAYKFSIHDYFNGSVKGSETITSTYPYAMTVMAFTKER